MHAFIQAFRDSSGCTVTGLQIIVKEVEAGGGEEDLQDVKILPASPQAEDPHKQRSACVYRAARRAAQLLGHADPKEVEECYGYDAGCCSDLQLPRHSNLLRCHSIASSRNQSWWKHQTQSQLHSVAQDLLQRCSLVTPKGRKADVEGLNGAVQWQSISSPDHAQDRQGYGRYHQPPKPLQTHSQQRRHAIPGPEQE